MSAIPRRDAFELVQERVPRTVSAEPAKKRYEDTDCFDVGI
jgi:hypothetical protein